MSYDAPEGEVSAILRSEEGVPVLPMGTGPSIKFVAPGSLTGGRYGLFRWDMPPRSGGPESHFHRTFSESFFVLEGTVRLYDGAAWLDARPGDFLYVPEGGIHAFSNASREPASMLILFAPGASREAYFEELAAIRTEGRRLSPEEWTDLYARHDQYMV